MTDFERGAEAMRRECRRIVECYPLMGVSLIADAIRALPLPVQPPGSESREARLEKALEALVHTSQIVRDHALDLQLDDGMHARALQSRIDNARRALAPDARPEEKK